MMQSTLVGIKALICNHYIKVLKLVKSNVESQKTVVFSSYCAVLPNTMIF
jgi:hypothetical protein